MRARRDAERDDTLARELAAFERGTIDPASFDHAAHVRMAFAMVGRHAFDDALARYSRALRRLCASAGRPDRYHATVTVAFLALVGERRMEHRAGDDSWDAFAERNPDLFRRDCLDRWYDPAVLGSDRARRTFILPAPRR